MMNNRSGAWLTGEESLQTVIDIVPGVVGLGGNSDQQDESQYRRQAEAQQMPSIKTHCSSSSSVFSRDVKEKNRCRQPENFTRHPWPFEDFQAMATGADQGVAPVERRLLPVAGQPRTYSSFR